MSTIDERRRIAEAGTGRDGFVTTVALTPIAAPSILGLFGFAGATLIVAAHLAGWYGDADTPLYLAPFAGIFGGVAQFTAGLFAYRARDGVATAMHGMWGSFWIAYMLLHVMLATGDLETGRVMDVALAFWFVALSAITYSGTLGALVEGNVAVTAVLGTLATGALFAAIGLGWGLGTWETVAGWVFVFSAGFAWYTATAMMLAAASGKTILPLFKMKREANVPGREPTRPIEFEWAEPGVKQGQ